MALKCVVCGKDAQKGLWLCPSCALMRQGAQTPAPAVDVLAEQSPLLRHGVSSAWRSGATFTQTLDAPLPPSEPLDAPLPKLEPPIAAASQPAALKNYALEPALPVAAPTVAKVASPTAKPSPAPHPVAHLDQQPPLQTGRERFHSPELPPPIAAKPPVDYNSVRPPKPVTVRSVDTRRSIPTPKPSRVAVDKNSLRERDRAVRHIIEYNPPIKREELDVSLLWRIAALVSYAFGSAAILYIFVGAFSNKTYARVHGGQAVILYLASLLVGHLLPVGGARSTLLFSIYALYAVCAITAIPPRLVRIPILSTLGELLSYVAGSITYRRN